MYHPAMEPRPVSCSSFVPLLRRMSYLILKRGFDLVFSLVLLVTCALLMAVIALVVWLDHCSVLFDLWCLLKTIPVVFTMKGAR